MITIDLIDENFDQPEKPARLQALSAKPGRGRTQTLPEAISASRVQQDVERSHPGLFAALWLGIKSLFSR